MIHSERWQYLSNNNMLCDCQGYSGYKEHNIYFCVNCERPIPEPEETNRGAVRTVGIEHLEATGIPMSYYNKYYEGNMKKVMIEYLANNNNVYTVGDLDDTL